MDIELDSDEHICIKLYLVCYNYTLVTDNVLCYFRACVHKFTVCVRRYDCCVLCHNTQIPCSPTIQVTSRCSTWQ